VEKARSWFQRATAADPDYGDAWAFWYKFESALGLPEQQEFVIESCVAANPRHGDRWPRVAKALENEKKSTREILIILASQLPQAV
jgi:pre-mRNA-processing factor 6